LRLPQFRCSNYVRIGVNPGYSIGGGTNKIPELLKLVGPTKHLRLHTSRGYS
jgi:hypothetical protein